MKFVDEAIVVNIRIYGENSLIVKLFSGKNGLYSAFVRKKSLQIGDLISFEFRRTNEDGLGNLYSIDLVRPYCRLMIFDPLSLDISGSTLLLIEELIPEWSEQELLFGQLIKLFEIVIKKDQSSKAIIKCVKNYIEFELLALNNSGYGIDISSCVVTGDTEDLAFVSPKSARAVCRSAGAGYANRLLRLPQFLISDQAFVGGEELVDGLKLVAFFLHKFTFSEKSTQGIQSEKAKQHLSYHDRLIEHAMELMLS